MIRGGSLAGAKARAVATALPSQNVERYFLWGLWEFLGPSGSCCFGEHILGLHSMDLLRSRCIQSTEVGLHGIFDAVWS